MASLSGFTLSDFAFEGVSKPVYRIGEGPAVVLIHELPGMTPQCVDLARRLASAGYAVYLPLLFGEPMKDYGITPLLWPCVWKEFNLLGAKAKSPVTDWLRALARSAHAERGGKGVGAIGMCLTGGFALSMMLDPELLAPVVCQPSMPLTPWGRAELGLPDDEWACARRRVKEEGAKVLGFQFTRDPVSPRARFQTLKDGLGEGFREVVIEGAKHSVLTHHFRDMSAADQARVWGELTAFLAERLR